MEYCCLVHAEFPEQPVSRQLHCYGICLFPVAFGEGQIPSRRNIHVLTDFALI